MENTSFFSIKKTALVSAFMVFSLVRTGNCSNWIPAGGNKVDYVVLSSAGDLSGCPTLPVGQGWISFGFKGDNYNYLMQLNDSSLGKAVISMLLAAQSAGKKVMINWDGTADCGGNRVFHAIQIVPQ